MVTRRGQVLTLLTDGVTAKPLQVMRAHAHARGRHVMEFARVEAMADGRLHAEPGGLTLAKGTRVVVLDVTVAGNFAHLRTHTTEPVSGPSAGAAVYGCTEFVFEIPPEVLRGGDVTPLVQLIERSLAWTPDERVCSPDDSQLCLEP